jgi:HrpA-like RNA helicase
MFPVSVNYSPPEYLHDFGSTLETILGIVEKIESANLPGDILIFLSGEAQIKDCITALQAQNPKNSLICLPLYGRLSQEEQERVFEDFAPKRKVVIATNIAETSITIDGMRFVIDPGFAKLNFYNQRNFTSSLVEVPIAKASCNQRKGRAGRTAPGKCHRLYTREDYDDRQLFTKEEIYRRDLSEVVLRMAELGIRDFEEFDFISDPGAENIRGAVEALGVLEAIDDKRDLTTIGELMVRFPIIPRLARMIVASIMDYPEVLEEVLIAAAFLNDRAPFLLPQGLELEARKAHHSFRHKMGDFLSYLNIYRGFDLERDKEGFCSRYYLDFKGMNEIYNVKRQLGEIVSAMGIPITGGGEISRYLCAVSKGLVNFVCRRTKKMDYSSLTAYGIKIHPGSVMYRQRPEYIVAGEIFRTSQMYAMSVSPLYPEWIKEISPHLYSNLVRRHARPKTRPLAGREYANFIRIGRQRFEIELGKKGKKTAILPYEKLREAVSSLDVTAIQNYRGLKGKVIFKGSEILRGMNLERILRIAPKLNFTRNIVDNWPKGAHLEYLRDSHQIVQFIPQLLQPSRKSKSRGRLGFLTLLTDGNGAYWFSAYGDFLQALEESISSLESLIDEDVNILSEEQEKVVNAAYRGLTQMLAE